MEIVVNHQCRRNRAVPRAGHRSRSETPFWRSVSESYAHMILNCTENAPAVISRAGFAYTYSNEMSARGLSPEVNIVRQDSSDLGITHNEHMSTLRNDTRRD